MVEADVDVAAFTLTKIELILIVTTNINTKLNFGVTPFPQSLLADKWAETASRVESQVNLCSMCITKLCIVCRLSLSFVRALFASQCEAEAHISDALRLIVVLYIYVCLKQLSQISKGRKLGKVACRIQNTTSHSPSGRPGYCSKLCFFLAEEAKDQTMLLLRFYCSWHFVRFHVMRSREAKEFAICSVYTEMLACLTLWNPR